MYKIAILQSNYLPWKGVFDMIHQVDEFVFLEDVQYTQRDWRNRNKIVTPNGLQWITVPIKHSNKFSQKIYEAEILVESDWQKKHKKAFMLNYSKAPYFQEYKWVLDRIYDTTQWHYLSDLNRYAIQLICEILEIDTKFTNARDIPKTCEKDDRLIEICKYLKADYYLSGPAAKNYIVPSKFEENKIQLSYMDYRYPEYRQMHGHFEHGVTILDVLFNCGNNASMYIWGANK